MRFRLGLAMGFAAGYVLGSKAGHQRYEQIERTTKKVWESAPAEKIRHEIAEMRHRNGDTQIDLERDAMRTGMLPA